MNIPEVGAGLVEALNLGGAFDAEIVAERNLVPPEPWLDGLEHDRADLVAHATTALRSGLRVGPAPIVLARKPGFGTRPIPFLSIEERIVYRALVDRACGEFPPLDRSHDAYVRFSTGPLYYSFDAAEEQSSWIVGSSTVTHVVKTDIASFYDYVDHQILREEILDSTADYETVDLLTRFLGATQGREFGLPQLYDPSDVLSEIYAAILERGLLRKGHPTWRFNDDFRIASSSYADALSVIETLSMYAREIGLVLSEHKTYTPRFVTYAFDTLDVGPDDALRPRDQLEMEDSTADYVATDPAARLADAQGLVGRVQVPGTGGGATLDRPIHLDELRSKDYSSLRRAFRVLAEAADTTAIDLVLPLMVYAPALTPYLASYLLAIRGTQSTAIVNELITSVSLGDWQKMWVVDVIGRSEALANPDADAVRKWMSGELDGDSDIVRAYAAYWLARHGAVDFDILADAEWSAPSSLRPAYLSGIAALAGSASPPDTNRIRAIRDARRENAWFIPN